VTRDDSEERILNTKALAQSVFLYILSEGLYSWAGMGDTMASYKYIQRVSADIYMEIIVVVGGREGDGG
jgi:hypothetical protein